MQNDTIILCIHVYVFRTVFVTHLGYHGIAQTEDFQRKSTARQAAMPVSSITRGSVGRIQGEIFLLADWSGFLQGGQGHSEGSTHLPRIRICSTYKENIFGAIETSLWEIYQCFILLAPRKRCGVCCIVSIQVIYHISDSITKPLIISALSTSIALRWKTNVDVRQSSMAGWRTSWQSTANYFGQYTLCWTTTHLKVHMVSPGLKTKHSRRCGSCTLGTPQSTFARMSLPTLTMSNASRPLCRWGSGWICCQKTSPTGKLRNLDFSLRQEKLEWLVMVCAKYTALSFSLSASILWPRNNCAGWPHVGWRFRSPTGHVYGWASVHLSGIFMYLLIIIHHYYYYYYYITPCLPHFLSSYSHLIFIIKSSYVSWVSKYFYFIYAWSFIN